MSINKPPRWDRNNTSYTVYACDKFRNRTKCNDCGLIATNWDWWKLEPCPECGATDSCVVSARWVKDKKPWYYFGFANETGRWEVRKP